MSIARLYSMIDDLPRLNHKTGLRNLMLRRIMYPQIEQLAEMQTKLLREHAALNPASTATIITYKTAKFYVAFSDSGDVLEILDERLRVRMDQLLRIEKDTAELINLLTNYTTFLVTVCVNQHDYRALVPQVIINECLQALELMEPYALAPVWLPKPTFTEAQQKLYLAKQHGPIERFKVLQLNKLTS